MINHPYDLRGQSLHEITDNGGRQKCRESEPVGLHTVEKTIVSVLTEILPVRFCSHLHVHAAGIENIPKSITEDLHDRNTFFCAGTCLTEQLSNMEHRKEFSMFVTPFGAGKFKLIMINFKKEGGKSAKINQVGRRNNI